MRLVPVAVFSLVLIISIASNILQFQKISNLNEIVTGLTIQTRNDVKELNMLRSGGNPVSESSSGRN